MSYFDEFWPLPFLSMETFQQWGMIAVLYQIYMIKVEWIPNEAMIYVVNDSQETFYKYKKFYLNCEF